AELQCLVNNPDGFGFALALRQPQLPEAAAAEPGNADTHPGSAKCHVIHNSPSELLLTARDYARSAPCTWRMPLPAACGVMQKYAMLQPCRRARRSCAR